MIPENTQSENPKNEPTSPVEVTLLENPNLNVLIGQRIAELRQMEKMSKKDLADFLGLSPSAFFAKEKGVDASFTTRELLTLSTKFKVPVDTLFCELSIEEGLNFQLEKDKVKELQALREKLAKHIEVIQHLQKVIAIIDINL